MSDREHPIRPVLLVEDDRDDITFVRRAFRRAALLNPLIVARSAAEGRRAIEGAHAAPPLLIVVDLALQGRESGLDFMAWLRAAAPRRYHASGHVHGLGRSY